MTFEKFGGDFIQRTGRDARSGNAELLGFRQDLFVLDTELF
jgi:hypothetical protein